MNPQNQDFTSPVNGSQWWNNITTNTIQELSNNSVMQPSGKDWVIIMNSDTFLQLAKSGVIKL